MRFQRAHWARATTWASVSEPSTGPLSPSFPVARASSILVTRSTAAFLVVPLSGLAASPPRTLSIFGPTRAPLPAVSLIGASKRAVGEEVVAFSTRNLPDRGSAGSGER